MMSDKPKRTIWRIASLVALVCLCAVSIALGQADLPVEIDEEPDSPATAPISDPVPVDLKSDETAPMRPMMRNPGEVGPWDAIADPFVERAAQSEAEQSEPIEYFSPSKLVRDFQDPDRKEPVVFRLDQPIRGLPYTEPVARFSGRPPALKIQWTDHDWVREPDVDYTRPICGDINFDGRLDKADAAAFAAAVNDPVAYRLKHGEIDHATFVAAGDINNDQRVDMDDWKYLRRAIVRAQRDFDGVVGFHPGKRRQWSAMGPPADSRLIYVSSSEGDDRGRGHSPARPVRTIARAMELVRHRKPDWILLKRGDVWTGEGFINWTKSGRSMREPIVITSYGPGNQRPIIRSEGASAVSIPLGIRLVAYVVFTDLDCIDYRKNPGDKSYMTNGKTDAGFWFGATEGMVFIENCRFQYYGSGIVSYRAADAVAALQANMRKAPATEEDDADKSEPNTDAADPDATKILVVRFTNVAYSYNRTAHAQGLYAHRMSHLIIENCIFHHNGHLPEANSPPTMYNHNLYLTRIDHNVVRDNLISWGAAHGMQMRHGGMVQNNVFYNNASHMFVASRPSIVSQNVYLHARDMTDTHRLGQGLGVIDMDNAFISQNLFAEKDDSSKPGWAISVRPRDSMLKTTIVGNVFSNWHGPRIIWWNPTLTDGQVAGNVFRNQNPLPTTLITGVRKLENVAEQLKYANNFYAQHDDGELPPAATIRGSGFDMKRWRKLGAEPRPLRAKLTPLLDAADLNALVGGNVPTDQTDKHEAFIEAALSNDRLNWDRRLSPAAAADFMRYAYRMTLTPPDDDADAALVPSGAPLPEAEATSQP